MNGILGKSYVKPQLEESAENTDAENEDSEATTAKQAQFKELALTSHPR